MFSILNEISNNSPFRTTSVVVASVGTSAFLYVLVAITGYLSFGNGVSGNIVSMYIPSIASTIGKAAIVILVMFSYPLQVHPCRASVDAILKWRPIRRSETGKVAARAATRENGKDGMGETRFAAITTAIIVLSYVVAMTVSSLEKVLAYVGSTGSTSISFILPGLFYYKISAPDSGHRERLRQGYDDEDEGEDSREDEGLLGGERIRSASWRKGWLRRCSLALAIYGAVVMITCLVTNTLFVVAH